MKSIRLILPLVALVASAALQAQSYHAIAKNQNFLQTSGSTVAADPITPFVFTAQSAVNATLTLPNGGTATFVYEPGDNRYAFRQSFATKEALDAAFPNGIYRMTGPGIPTLSFTLASDNYPTVTPQVASVSNGTWNSGGVLVVNPAQSVTLNFSTFSGYATSGVAGHMNFSLVGMTESLHIDTERFSQAIFGATAQPTPFTSYTIPAGTFTSGRVYQAWLDFDTVITMDTTTLPGSAVGTMLSKETAFYIAAQTPGTSTLPPVMVAPLTSRSAVIGGSTTFSVAITIGGVRANHQSNPNNIPLGFTWTLNGRHLGDASASSGKYINNTGDTLTINSLTAADAGNYAVTIATAGGVVSSVATLTFSTANTPVITTQPRGATVNAGSTVALTIAATGSPTPTYQWRKDGVAINGATSDTLVLASVATSAAGNYTVVVANSAGFATSSAALLAVTSGQPSQLPNLSVRTTLGASQTLIVGFATSGSKTMLVRGIGPTLAAFGLSGVLPDPTIELYSASSKIDENNDWNANLSTVFAAVGAFALTGSSKDAALQRACTGAYTAQIKSVGSGVVLVEVYDTGGTGKLINVSARNAVGTGDNILIAGFVVGGTAAKTLLIRGVGAKLAEFGVTGVLADPKLEIFDNNTGTKIAENDSWNFQLQPVARSVGAFDLTLGSKDAALLITLPPGTYTAQISGIGATTGEALVEVYEVP